jgi:hypothetical protein
MIRKYLAAILLMLCQICAFGEGRVYTKKARLEDFPSRTTRVVLTGLEVFDTVLKQEISSRWMVSPYEFCTVTDYTRDRYTDLYYFVRFTFDSDFTYMTLTKGGDTDDENQLKQGFDVVMIPIAPAYMTGGDELVFLPAYIDIMQEYITKAMASERVAFRGLKSLCSKPSGVILTDRQEAISAFLSAEADKNAKVVITSSSSKKSIEMIITTDTHELRRIKKKR